MNVRAFALILFVASLLVLAFGVYLWTTGVPDDGRYHVQASNPLELIADNRQLVGRRQSARLPLILGACGVVLFGAMAMAARRPPPDSAASHRHGA